MELEVSVCYGYSSKLYDLGVSHAATILAAMTRFIITDAETCTWNSETNKQKKNQWERYPDTEMVISCPAPLYSYYWNASLLHSKFPRSSLQFWIHRL